jgi:site-specific DNA-cytosine methylase
VIIREMVTGIFDVDGGSPFWAAVDRYRDAGYAVAWAVRMARRHGDPTSRRRVFLVAIQPECIADGKTAVDFFSVEGTSCDEVTVGSCLDEVPDEGLLYPRPQDVTILPERETDGYDGPRLVGTIGIGGMGWSVYDATGPAVTMKTWGQGPGGATALYRDSEGHIRRLSPWEALRTHSFPTEFIEFLRAHPDVSDTDAYRLCGNSIPVLMLRDIVEHIVNNIIKPQVLADVAKATQAHCAARDAAAAARETAADSRT